MRHVLSTHLFINHRLTTVWLEKIRQAGIPSVEIFCARQHLDYRDRAQIAELGHWFRDSTLKLHSLHSPMYTDEIWGRSGPNSIIDITEPVKAKRLDMLDEIKRALDIAEIVPFQFLIQHIGVTGDEYDERGSTPLSRRSKRSAFSPAQRGVEVLLENTQNRLATAERLMMFLQITHLKLGFCFDVGHANMNEGVEPAFRLMKKQIRSTHLHDNDGKSDGHLFPLSGEGTIDWKKTMDLLRARPDQYPLLLELSEVPEVAHPIEAARDIFEKLESL